MIQIPGIGPGWKIGEVVLGDTTWERFQLEWIPGVVGRRKGEIPTAA